MPDTLTFAQGLLAQGIEFVVRKNGRLAVWPGKAHKYLTDAEKEFIREHRDELIALAAAKALPETTVAWRPPAEGAAETAVHESANPKPDACPFCWGTCVGPNHDAYRTLHWNDPREAERRAKEATAVMMRQVGRS